jgi:hypothetical protein
MRMLASEEEGEKGGWSMRATNCVDLSETDDQSNQQPGHEQIILRFKLLLSFTSMPKMCPSICMGH